MTASSFLALWAGRLAIVLAFSYALSLPARQHWIFDLFRNFLIQYAVGGLILGLVLMYFHNLPLAVLCLAVFAGSFCQIKKAFPVSTTPKNGDKYITIAHYNRLYGNSKHDEMISWLRRNARRFDVVSIHEITDESSEKLQEIHDLYPWRFPEMRRPDTDVCFLSRYPITESEMIVTKGDVTTLPGLRIKVETPAGSLTVYGIHAESPLDQRLQLQRNTELKEIARAIARDQSPNIVFLGDWNITPFSPHFYDVLKISKLKNEYSGNWPPVTWPTRFMLPFLKIPIDHILFSKNLKLVAKNTGPSMGSDHHALIASFTIDL